MKEPNSFEGFVDVTDVLMIPLRDLPPSGLDVAAQTKASEKALHQATKVQAGEEGFYGFNNGFFSFTRYGRTYLGRDSQQARSTLGDLGLEYSSVSVPFSNQERTPNAAFIDEAVRAGVFPDRSNYFQA